MANRVEPERLRLSEEDRAWILSLIAQAQSRHFFGKLILSFEDGKLKRAVKEESLKPPSEIK